MGWRASRVALWGLLLVALPSAWTGRPDASLEGVVLRISPDAGQAGPAPVSLPPPSPSTTSPKKKAAKSPPQQQQAAQAVSVVTYDRSTWSWDRYHTHDELAAYLKGLQDRYPNNCNLSTIGQSLNGRSIFAMEVSSSKKPRSAKPTFMYIGNMHGDEVVNRELLLRLLGQLCEAKESRIKDLLDATVIQIIPTMNPDGYSDEPAQRGNAQGYDLNRNWMQAMIDDGVYPYDPPTPAQIQRSDAAWTWYASGRGALQQENQVVRSWAKRNPPLLSANLHGGAMVVSLPMDACDQGGQRTWCPHPEWPLTQTLGLAYSIKNPTMYKTKTQAYNGSWVGRGVIQGAAWYPVLGSMADWFSYSLGSLQLTIEVWEAKYPPPSPALGQAWAQHKDSLVRLMEMTHMGLAGRVVDGSSGKPLTGNISVLQPPGDAYYASRINDQGYFWKLMAPGQTYTLVIQPSDPSSRQVVYQAITWSGGLGKGLTNDKLLQGSGLRDLSVVKTFKAQRVRS